MADPARTSARPLLPAGVRLGVLATAVALVALGLLTMLTPAFTDWEVETDPGLGLLLSGGVRAGLEALPVYAGAVLVEAPFAGLVRLLGGGDLATYRATAVPGALGMLALAWVALRWLAHAGADRRFGLAVVGVIGLSSCVASAWTIGHPEEVLVGAAALGGVVLVAGARGRAVLAGAALVGLAAAAKPSVLVLLPLAIACTRSGREAVRVALVAAAAGALIALPALLVQFGRLAAVATATGSDGVSSKGNLWWFLGTPNPAFSAPDARVVRAFTLDNSARITPPWIAEHAHLGILVLSAVLALAWWLRVGRPSLAAAGSRERVAAVLWMAAAVVWWRSIADPWFQAYYLVAALPALALARARLGRPPVAAIVAWVLLWLLHGPNAPVDDLSPDAISALRLAWLVPFALWVTTKALRPVRATAPPAPPPADRSPARR